MAFSYLQFLKQRGILWEEHGGAVGNFSVEMASLEKSKDPKDLKMFECQETEEVVS